MQPRTGAAAPPFQVQTSVLAPPAAAVPRTPCARPGPPGPVGTGPLAPPMRPWQDGVGETGVSVAYTVLKCDAGPILAQRKVGRGPGPERAGLQAITFWPAWQLPTACQCPTTRQNEVCCAHATRCGMARWLWTRTSRRPSCWHTCSSRGQACCWRSCPKCSRAGGLSWPTRRTRPGRCTLQRWALVVCCCCGPGMFLRTSNLRAVRQLRASTLPEAP